MKNSSVVVIVGLGEVGQPLLSVLSRHYACVGVDIHPVKLDRSCSVMHVCYPFQIPDFVGTTIKYIEQYDPNLVVVNSTVAVGTTQRIQSHLPYRKIVYSPIRGKHAKMELDLTLYKKFVGGSDSAAVEVAVRHFADAGFKTDTFRNSEVGELSKLLETTYFGILIAWAQEVERFAARFGATFDDVNKFIKEVEFLPGHIFPGVIGGHCVMPNIEILKAQCDSEFLSAIQRSNDLKALEAVESAA